MFTISDIFILTEIRMAAVIKLEQAFLTSYQSHPRAKFLKNYLEDSNKAFEQDEDPSIKEIVEFLRPIKKEATNLKTLASKLDQLEKKQLDTISSETKKTNNKPENFFKKIAKQLNKENKEYSTYENFVKEVKDFKQQICSRDDNSFSLDEVWPLTTKKLKYGLIYDALISNFNIDILLIASNTSSIFNQAQYTADVTLHINELFCLIEKLSTSDNMTAKRKELLKNVKANNVKQMLEQSFNEFIDTIAISNGNLKAVKEDGIDLCLETFNLASQAYKEATKNTIEAMKKLKASAEREIGTSLNAITRKLTAVESTVKANNNKDFQFEDLKKDESNSSVEKSENTTQQHPNSYEAENNTKLTAKQIEDIKQILANYIAQTNSKPADSNTLFVGWNPFNNPTRKASILAAHKDIATNMQNEIDKEQDLTRGKLIALLQTYADLSTQKDYSIKHPGKGTCPAYRKKSGDFYNMLLSIRDAVTTKEFFEKHYRTPPRPNKN